MNLRELVELAIAAGHRDAEADSAELEATLWANAHLEPDARSRLERGGRSYDVKTGTTADGYVVVTFENVTAKLEAEEALRASEARLRAILDAMPDCVKIFDEDGQLIYINPCGLELLEAPSFEILNASGHVSVPAEYLQDCLDVHCRVIAGETIVWSYEVIGMRGSRRHVEAHAVPFRMPDGTRAHICISRDITQRKTAEDALRRSEERLRLVQDATGLADFEADADGIAHCSLAFLRQLGLPDDSSRALKFEDWVHLVHSEDRDRLRAVERSLAANDSAECEFRIVRANTGEVRWISSKLQLERDEQGTLRRGIGAHLDITERKRAEEGLRESEARLRGILDAAPDCVKMFSESGQLIYINPRGLDLLEAPDLETLNALGDTLIPAEYLAERQEVHDRVLAGETAVWSYEVVGLRGSRRHVEAHAVPFRTPNGARAHLSILRDIDERKRADTALRRSEQHLRLVQDATGLADFETGADGLMTGSKRFFEQLGLPPADGPIPAKAWAEQVHPADIGWLVNILDEAIAHGREGFSGEFRIIRADTGETRWLACNTRMEYDKEGKLVRTIGAHIDITGRKRSEEALRASEERLRLVQEATGLADFDAGLMESPIFPNDSWSRPGCSPAPRNSPWKSGSKSFTPTTGNGLFAISKTLCRLTPRSSPNSA
jgi:PAS domain S-box-containing protein